LTLIPDAAQALFQQALTEAGAQRGRPTAPMWVAPLDEVRKRLRHCGFMATHVYPDLPQTCPWSVLEQQSVARDLK
jgi:DNA-binding helix-hairpin-helix protein with protein kinase domain